MSTLPGPVVTPETISGLRVFQPRTQSTRRVQNTETPRTFSDFDIAFQNATGWELAWNPPRDRISCSNGPGSARGKNHDWIRIDDMSHRLPPGVPAVSRIYSENLILKLNRLLGEIGVSNEKILEKEQDGTTSLKQGKNTGSLQPCFLNSVSVVPVTSSPFGPDCSTGFQWVVRKDGSFMVGAFEISGSDESIHAGLVAAQASFLTASRFGGECSDVLHQVRAGIEQVFCGDIGIRLIVLALDPLLGFATICGDDCFGIRLDRQKITMDRQASTGFLWLRGQNLILGNSMITNDCEGSDNANESWFNLVERSVSRSNPRDWQAAIMEHLQRQIPRLRTLPNLALVMARH